MASRQSGVHFSYLVVALVICLGLIFFIVLQNGDLNNLRGVIAKANNELDKRERKNTDYITERNRLR